jgi:hypothetical protein
LIREYMVEGKVYWIILGWSRHQRIDKPTYKHPLPVPELLTLPANSPSTRGDIDEHLQSAHGELEESSPPERNGKEWNGKDKDICEVETSPSADFEANQTSNDQVIEISEEVNEIFNHWKMVMSHARAKLDKKRQGKIIAALELGYSVEELLQAINGCATSSWYMGMNDRNHRYDAIDLIFRDADHIDQFINYAINPPTTEYPTSGNDMMRSAI